jgi:hypothetical protein
MINIGLLNIDIKNVYNCGYYSIKGNQSIINVHLDNNFKMYGRVIINTYNC